LSRRLRILQGLVALVVVGYLGWLIYQRWLAVKDVQLSFQWPAFLAGCAVLAVFYGLYSFCWQFTLHLMDPGGWRPRRLDLHRIFFISFITRYLPAGSVVNIGGRVELYKRLGGRRSRGLQSIYYEQLSLILGVLIFGLIGLHFYQIIGMPPWLALARDWILALFALGILAAYFGADLLIIHARPWMRLGRLQAVWTPVSFGSKALIWMVFSVVNLAQGGAVYWMLRSIYPPLASEPRLIYLVVTAYLVGRLAGQVAAPVPGGLGVREGAFTFLLSAHVPVQAAVVSASVFRLASMIMEAVIAGSLIGLTQLSPTPETGPVPNESGMADQPGS
jgi:uncharacterized membrane protein YbhN (UPF0104 family)